MTLFALVSLLAPIALAHDTAPTDTAADVPTDAPVQHDAAGAHPHDDPYEATSVEARAPRQEGGLSALAGVMDFAAPLPAVSVEVAITRRLSISGHLGLGVHEDLALATIGGDLRGYLLGDFDGGLFVGGGVSRTNLTPVSVGDETYTFDALLGAKWVHRSGFTFEGAATAQLYVLPYAAAFQPSGRVGVGWTF